MKLKTPSRKTVALGRRQSKSHFSRKIRQIWPPVFICPITICLETVLVSNRIHRRIGRVVNYDSALLTCMHIISLEIQSYCWDITDFRENQTCGGHDNSRTRLEMSAFATIIMTLTQWQRAVCLPLKITEIVCDCRMTMWTRMGNIHNFSKQHTLLKIIKGTKYRVDVTFNFHVF